MSNDNNPTPRSVARQTRANKATARGFLYWNSEQ